MRLLHKLLSARTVGRVALLVGVIYLPADLLGLIGTVLGNLWAVPAICAALWLIAEGVPVRIVSLLREPEGPKRRSAANTDDAALAFAHRFAGWLKSEEINAPPAMEGIFDASYEAEKAAEFEAGQLTAAEYERALRPVAERREWERRVRSEYQRDWRADVARWFEHGRRSGTLDAEDVINGFSIENPHRPEEFAGLADGRSTARRSPMM